MSNANFTQISITEETTLGTTPATPPFEIIRVTGANLAEQKTVVESKELNPDGNVRDEITVGLDAGGDIPIEMSFGNITSLLRGTMRSEYVFAPVRDNNGTAASVITAVSSTDVTVSAGSTTRYNSGTVAPQHLVLTSGFAAAGNNALRVAGTGTTGTTLKLAGGTVDAAPAAAARAKVIGFQGASGDITATSTGLASTTLDFTTLGLAVGTWVYVGSATSGMSFATAANTGWARISVIAATALTFDVLPTGWTTDAGTSKTIRVFFGDYIRNGTTRRSYTVEQYFSDLTTPTYEYYKGQVPVGLEVAAQQRSVLTGKVTFLGLTAVSPATTRFTGATTVAANTNPIMNASNNVGTLLMNGVAISGGNYVTGATWTTDIGGRRINAIGSLTSVDIGMGMFRVKVKLDTYYGDSTILTIIRASTALSFFMPVVDPGGTAAYLFDLPRAKTGDGNPTVPGVDTDRMLSTELTGLKHSTLLYTLHVSVLEQFGT